MKLANEALKQGCNPLVEIGYQESENFQKLSFLHLLTGNLPGLDEIEDYAKTHDDKISEFNIALYKGDIKKRIKILSETGQIALAYKMAKVHGVEEYADAILKGVPTIEKKIKWSKKSSALLPPKPLVPDYEEASEIMNGWPVYEVSEEKAAFANMDSDEEDGEIGEAVDLENESEDEEESEKDDQALLKEADENWGGGLSDDLGDSDSEYSDVKDGKKSQDDEDNGSGMTGFFVQNEDPLVASVKKESILAYDSVAVGEFSKA